MNSSQSSPLPSQWDNYEISYQYINGCRDLQQGRIKTNFSLDCEKINKIQPKIFIIKYHNQNTRIIIDEFKSEDNTELHNPIQNYFDKDVIIRNLDQMIQKFSFHNQMRINVKAKLESITKKNDINNQEYYIGKLKDCLSPIEITVVSFKMEEQLDLDKIYVFQNILVHQLNESKELRYKINKETIIYPLSITDFSEVNHINQQKIGKKINVIGFIYSIIDLPYDFQKIILTNEKGQQVKLKICLPFAKKFELQQKQFMGFLDLIVYQKRNSHVGLQFDDQSKFQKVISFGTQDQDKSFYEPKDNNLVRLDVTRSARNLIGINFIRIQQRVQNSCIENFEFLKMKIILDNQVLYVYAKQQKLIERILSIKIKEKVSTYFKRYSQQEFETLLQQKVINRDFDFVLKVHQDSKQYEIIKLYDYEEEVQNIRKKPRLI